MRRHRRVQFGDDSGFSLMEVIVSILIITIVMTAVLSLFMGSVRAATDRDRRSDAVQLATQAMERVRSTPVGAQPSIVSGSVGQVPTAGAGLVVGRSQAEVATQWSRGATPNRPAAPAELATMNQTYQQTPVAPTSTLPFSSLQSVGNQQYTVDTYVGFCYATRSGCTKTAPSPAAVPVYKVVVQVSWDQGQGRVNDYVTSTLMDASTDQIFKGA